MDHQHVPPSARPGGIVGTDGSTTALRAVAWAAAEAKLRGAGLLIVHAAPYADTESGRRHANAILTRARTVARHERGLPITTRVLLPEPRTALREVAQDADLLVVGMIAETAADALIGSVATAITAHAPCPVVVVRGEIDQKKGDDTEPVDGPVVVGIDGTPRSEAALKFAFEEASARQAPLVAVHTWSDALNDPYLAPMIDWDVVETEEELQLAERLAGWGEKYPDVPVERLVTRGRAASVLLDRSKGAQLVVVGSRGHGEFAGLLLDSVSNALIHGASCPVAIVRNTEES